MTCAQTGAIAERAEDERRARRREVEQLPDPVAERPGTTRWPTSVLSTISANSTCRPRPQRDRRQLIARRLVDSAYGDEPRMTTSPTSGCNRVSHVHDGHRSAATPSVDDAAVDVDGCSPSACTSAHRAARRRGGASPMVTAVAASAHAPRRAGRDRCSAARARGSPARDRVARLRDARTMPTAGSIGVVDAVAAGAERAPTRGRPARRRAPATKPAARRGRRRAGAAPCGSRP